MAHYSEMNHPLLNTLAEKTEINKKQVPPPTDPNPDFPEDVQEVIFDNPAQFAVTPCPTTTALPTTTGGFLAPTAFPGGPPLQGYGQGGQFGSAPIIRVVPGGPTMPPGLTN